MALSVPSPADLAALKGEQLDPDQYATIQTYLQIATDIVSLSTRVTENPPADSAIGRLFKWAILDVAWYIGTSLEERDAMFSPFSTERIGSYSYSKAMSAAKSGESLLGAPFFNVLRQFLEDDDEYGNWGGISLTTMSVMAETLPEYVNPISAEERAAALIDHYGR